MDRTNDGPEHRGTILIASADASFAELVGAMVARCGFTPVYPAIAEEPRLALRRTQPRVVICDCAAPNGLRRLIVEASARRLPLVLSDPRVDQHGAARARSLLHHVAWLTFPISREAFGRMLDALLASDDTAHAHPNAAAIAREVAQTIHAGTLGASDQRFATRSPSDLADERDLRSVIVAALSARPVYEQALRRGVWTYVGAERDAGASPGQVIVALTQLVDEASIAPMPVRRALMRSVLLWCVEAYFGRLGDGSVGRDSEAPDDAPVGAPRG